MEPQSRRVNTIALISKLTREKKIEIAFITVFSVFILGIFYVLISMNGVILGNDPAVDLQKAQVLVQTGKISLGTLSWSPPLYPLLLAIVISLTGASSIEQLIFLEKSLTVLVDWLLFLSVYLIGRKFFSKKIGATAAVLMLMCFPVYELNQWGGYTIYLAYLSCFCCSCICPLLRRVALGMFW